MNRWLTMLQFDVRLQARHGFYLASAVLVAIMAGMLMGLPAAARDNSALWVPALFVVNLPITTLFFIAGQILLEREEGTLNALSVTPFSARDYLTVRTITLVALGVVETGVIAAAGFNMGSWSALATGAIALGVFYTACGAGLSARFASVNELILPVSVLVTVFLLPLLPHFGLAPHAPFVIHPVEPALTLLRGAYGDLSAREWAFGAVGSLVWCALAWRWGMTSIGRAMRDTAATGGR